MIRLFSDTFQRRISWALLVAMGSVAAMVSSVAAAPFFDPTMPVHATPVNGGRGGIVARGLLIHAGGGEWLVFDQDLLRPVLWFQHPEGKDPLTLMMMSQASWEQATRKGSTDQPSPEPKTVTYVAPALPGVGAAPEEVLTDPRPVFGSDPGRGGLEASGRRFLGYQIAGAKGVLHYESHGARIREWHEVSRSHLQRHLNVAPGAEMVLLVAEGDFEITGNRVAKSEVLQVASNHAGLTLEMHGGRLLARLAPATRERRVTLSYGVRNVAPAAATPAAPAAASARWKTQVEARIKEAVKSGPGWIMDRIGLPESNPWKRRMRPADLVFLDAGKAAVITFEGDVWELALSGGRCRWRRIAAGLCEPLSIGQHAGVVQVFTRNGIVKLRDLNADGETDFYENHSSIMHQTASLRGYPLDMEVGEDGRTWIAIGGIMTNEKGFTNQAPPNPHSGAILEISADGKELQVLASHSREAFFAVDPVSGRIAMSDQQGNFIPSSGIFPVVPGASYGYGLQGAVQTTAPVVWIPHDEDTSSASPLWLRNTAFRAWEGGLLHLSYGTGRLFLVRPGETWPASNGAVIPLGIDTQIPVLHARVQPGEGAIWLAGFRVYDSRAPELEAMARLRPAPEPWTVPVDAQVVKEGVVLAFAAPLDPASVVPSAVQAKEWQYRRSSGYGSPRLKRDGQQGVDPVATAGTYLSRDGKRVFIHIPGLQPTMQMEVAHQFQFKGGKMNPVRVYVTVGEPKAADWLALGFEPPRLDGEVAAVRQAAGHEEAPTVERGKETAERFGCIACHSVDGAKEGHSGPTWKGLSGSERKFRDGSSRVADRAYLRSSILEPDKEIVEGYELGMASYAGVLSGSEIDSIILYIESLR